MRVSVVVAVFNAEATVADLVHQIGEALADRVEAYEIVLVEDGSADRSWAAIEDLVAARTDVRALRLRRNYGEDSASLCGIRAARHEVIVTLDDDLQHPPSEIGRLLDQLDAGFDLVYGVPRRQAHSAWRNASARAWKGLIESVLRVPHAREVTSFRAFRAELREAFADTAGPMASVDVLLSWGTARIDAVEVRHEPRRHGRSNYTLSRLLDHTGNLITGYSVAPLRFASYAGLLLVLVGLAGAVALLATGPVHAAELVLVALPVFAGVQLLALGIVGEYLARMHVRLTAAPSYVVAADIGGGPTDPTA